LHKLQIPKRNCAADKSQAKGSAVAAIALAPKPFHPSFESSSSISTLS